METKKGRFYIGRTTTGDEPVIYKADTLTTHGVIVGMTGSGKTGLGMNILEEALLSNVPTLVLDPKGDMGNIMLNFPDNAPQDLEPWMDAAKATRKGVSVADIAAEESEERRSELAAHDITAERIRQLRDNTEITIYTPGSTAGVGLNILGSLKAPDLDWDTFAEAVRDEIEGFVSSLLTLAGVDSDPVSGAEHILISTIIETWWKQGKDLDLATLIGQIPKPPFRKLGVFDLEIFLPQKDRMALALQLNGLLASPSFASWLEGEPLDIDTLIGPSDVTKCAVIYMAHLTEQERQFTTSLLLSKLVTWIRSQPGSSELRALVYLDEAFGYAPPTAEPPSKKPIMTILKQARAFGVGMILVTQNPVDLDYKAMSNAGTWIVGRLQTENDKKRILEGMRSVSGTGAIADLDIQISSLAKRQFILHLAKKSEQTLFSRRPAMCFRYGPFTREQVTSLMADKLDKTPDPTPWRVSAGQTDDLTVDGSVVEVAPPVAEGIEVVFMDHAASWVHLIGADLTGSHYKPGAAVTVQLLYDDTKSSISHNEVFEAIVFPLDGLIDTEDMVVVDHDIRDFKLDPPEGASFDLPDVKLQNKTFWTSLGADLKNYLVANRNVNIWQCGPLKLYSRVGETEDQFRARCEVAAGEAADKEMAKLAERFRTRIDRVKDQVSAADIRVTELEGDASARQQDEVMSGAGDLLGALFGGRKSSNPLSKAASRRASTQKAQARARSAAAKLNQKQQGLVDLEDKLAEELQAIGDRHDAMSQDIEPMEIGLEKTDIRVAETKLVWVPVSRPYRPGI